MTMTASAIGDLISRYGQALVLFARQWSPNPEDIVQDAFVKLVQLRYLPNDPVAWMYQVVRNRAIDLAKSERRRKDRESTKASWFVESDVDGLDAEFAVKALQDLSSELREVIVARVWGGLSFEQIAQVAGCSVSSAHRRFESGIAILRERLKVPCPTSKS